MANEYNYEKINTVNEFINSLRDHDKPSFVNILEGDEQCVGYVALKANKAYIFGMSEENSI